MKFFKNLNLLTEFTTSKLCNPLHRALIIIKTFNQVNLYGEGLSDLFERSLQIERLKYVK